MSGHDSFKQIEDIFGDDDLMKKVSPKFSELSLDIKDIIKYCENPAFLAALLFKLAEEREKTNKLLEQIYDKFDAIMFGMKTQSEPFSQQREIEQPGSIFSEQDQMIMHVVQENGKASADEIRTELGYRGKNAASQRLNRLFKEGHLRKIQSGRKVFYLARNSPTP